MSAPARQRPVGAPWMEDAACPDSGVDFFPTTMAGVLDAIAVCHRCPVRVDCLVHAINNAEAWGVWGGTSERERDRIRNKLRRAA